MGFRLLDQPPKARWDKNAEAVIVEAFRDTNRTEWINVSPTAIATSALSALYDAGFRVMGHRSGGEVTATPTAAEAAEGDI